MEPALQYKPVLRFGGFPDSLPPLPDNFTPKPSLDSPKDADNNHYSNFHFLPEPKGVEIEGGIRRIWSRYRIALSLSLIRVLRILVVLMDS
jgi:hypothetical protein